MSKKKESTIADYIKVFWLGLIVGLWTAAHIERSIWRQKTVERGLAKYNPTSGEWEWLGCHQ